MKLECANFHRLGWLSGLAVGALLPVLAWGNQTCGLIDKLAEFDVATGKIADIKSDVGAHSCSTSLELDGQITVNCYWAYVYRKASARVHFSNLVDALPDCGWVQVAQDGVGNKVNHPDSYEQRIFQQGTRRLSVSIKDKGQLQQTLIFLGLQ